MPKFLYKASYTPEGVRGLMKEGAANRRAAVQKSIASLGGKLEAFYFAYGDTDAYLIMDLPDAVASVALSMAVASSGAVHGTTVPLFTLEEFDAALKKVPAYRPPGA